MLNRRQVLALGTSGVAVAMHPPLICGAAAASTEREPTFRFSLNTSTISGQKLSLSEIIDLAAKAGYDGIEPWMREIDAEVKNGTSLDDLRKRIEDAGLTVDSAIGFAQWIVDDEQARAKGLEHAKRDMESIKAIGGTRIAAPPAGATNQVNLDLDKAAVRYHQLLELGETIGVIPQLEVWGFSKSLSRLAEVMYVAVQCQHPSARILPDVYHLYKGGSGFHGLSTVAGSTVEVFHMNDYPADPPREKIGDADRVYPGDGVAPLGQIIRTLYQNGFRGTLSLELFNRDYWQQDALAVAKTGLQKMKDAVAQALE